MLKSIASVSINQFIKIAADNAVELQTIKRYKRTDTYWINLRLIFFKFDAEDLVLSRIYEEDLYALY